MKPRTLLTLAADTRGRGMIEYALTACLLASFVIASMPQAAHGVSALLCKTASALAIASGETSQLRAR